MSHVSKTSYSPNAAKSSCPSQAIEDSKKKTSLLKDNSWIRRNAVEDEAVDQDPNFGRVVLNKYRSSDALDSAESANSNSSKMPITKTESTVEALQRRFGGSQEDLSKGRSKVYKTIVPEEPKKKSTTTTTKNDMTTQTSVNTSQSVCRSPVVKLPSDNTETFTDRVLTSKQGTPPSKPKVSETTDVRMTAGTTQKKTENPPVDLIPTSIQTEYFIPERDDTVPISPSRTVLERDLCSYCRSPMSSDPKMVLEDMKINCHTTCFKCEVCSSDLGHLKAGDSMWVYRRTIHCERCFEVTRAKWHR
ncbi:sciellin isoform X1 [Esox lucius]|uniref:sciellin isoform X1 n=1 Tax=Esox lucius TaxID=8010 RepID=UPI001476CFCA|nr:sciellin isoform X1 [Esox lucius]